MEGVQKSLSFDQTTWNRVTRAPPYLGACALSIEGLPKPLPLRESRLVKELQTVIPNSDYALSSVLHVHTMISGRKGIREGSQIK